MSKFIPEFARKAKPLNDIMSQKKCLYGTLHNNISKVEDSVIKYSSTRIVHPSRETMHASASAAVTVFLDAHIPTTSTLKQKQKSSEYHPIAYISGTATQRN